MNFSKDIKAKGKLSEHLQKIRSEGVSQISNLLDESLADAKS